MMQAAGKYHEEQGIKFINADEGKLQGNIPLVLSSVTSCWADLLHSASVESSVVKGEDSEEILEQGCVKIIFGF